MMRNDDKPTRAANVNPTSSHANGEAHAESRESVMDDRWGYDPETIVSMLYRLLLGREPDPAGLAHHAERLRADKVTAQEMARNFVRSTEYRRQAEPQTNGVINLAGAPSVRVEALGCEFVLPAGSDVVNELRSPQGYEPWVLPYFLDYCRPGMTVLDIGASWGVFSLPAARRVGQHGRVLAVEVSPWNCRVLTKSIQASQLNNVEVLPFGVSDRLGSALLPMQRWTNNNALDVTRNAEQDDLDRFDLIPVLPLDAIRAALSPVHIVKMDIEGMEYRTALGGISFLREQNPLVFSEYSPRFQQAGSGVDGRELLLLFFDLGYKIEILHRHAPREQMATADRNEVVKRVDGAWREHVERDGGTHLDLCFHPGGVLSSL